MAASACTIALISAPRSKNTINQKKEKKRKKRTTANAERVLNSFESTTDARITYAKIAGRQYLTAYVWASLSFPCLTPCSSRKMLRSDRKKRFVPKVRTGCKTCRSDTSILSIMKDRALICDCRKRRLKCDEKKPRCLRCEKDDFDCDRDSNRADRQSHVVSSALELRDKGLRVIASKRQISCITLGASPTQFPLARVGEDFQYLHRFIECTASSFEGYFRDPIWKESIFWACQHSQYILDGIVSLGALHKIRDFVEGSQEAKRHYDIAVERYGESIKAMRKAAKIPITLENGDNRYHLFITYCLLSFCFEAWIGSLQSAIRQVYQGLEFIQPWLDSQDSAPTRMELELVQLFTRLENSCIISLEHKVDDHSRSLKSRWIASERDEMPEVFASLEEARCWHETIVTSLLDALLKLRRLKIAAIRQAQSAHATQAGETILSYSTGMRQTLVQRFDRWHRSFLPFLYHSRQASNSDTFAAATALELRYVSSSTVLSGTFGLGESSCDAFNDNFAAAIELATALQDYEASNSSKQQYTATFTIDGSICPSLYAVAIKCREPRTRRAAIELLERSERREGLWDSRLLANVGRISMEIEEAGGLVDGVVPEPARIVGMRTVEKNLWGRWGSMSYFILKREAGNVGRMMPVEHRRDFRW
jgi:hypothetical protein